MIACDRETRGRQEPRVVEAADETRELEVGVRERRARGGRARRGAFERRARLREAHEEEPRRRLADEERTRHRDQRRVARCARHGVLGCSAAGALRHLGRASRAETRERLLPARAGRELEIRREIRDRGAAGARPVERRDADALPRRRLPERRRPQIRRLIEAPRSDTLLSHSQLASDAVFGGTDTRHQRRVSRIRARRECRRDALRSGARVRERSERGHRRCGGEVVLGREAVHADEDESLGTRRRRCRQHQRRRPGARARRAATGAAGRDCSGEREHEDALQLTPPRSGRRARPRSPACPSRRSRGAAAAVRVSSRFASR